MTERDAKIIKAVLDYLHQVEAQLTDAGIHDEVKQRVYPAPGLAEYLAAMEIADKARWIITMPARFGTGFKRSLSEAGEAARLEMNA
jgi:hypothetical protein